MAEFSPIKLRTLVRAVPHLPMWVLLEQSGIFEQVGITEFQYELCGSSTEAERALFEGDIDFISGNHITPYSLIAKGYPIVSIASPVNFTHDKLVTREPVNSIADLKGMRIGDAPLIASDGAYSHTRGNHHLYVERGGLDSSKDVEWVIIDKEDGNYFEKQHQAMRDGKIDAIFAIRRTDIYEKEGFHVKALDPLPMINGATLTSTMDQLEKVDQLGDRLVKAMVMGIHFARTQVDKTNKIFEQVAVDYPELGSVTAEKVAKNDAKPYPDLQGVLNAYELARRQYPEAEDVNPLTLWDLHYLRKLDHSGFIDELYK